MARMVSTQVWELHPLNSMLSHQSMVKASKWTKRSINLELSPIRGNCFLDYFAGLICKFPRLPMGTSSADQAALLLHPHLLWKPLNTDGTQMNRFRLLVNQNYMLNLISYEDLYQWSVENIGEFWRQVFSFTGIISSQPFTQVVDEKLPMNRIPEWFKGCR